MSVTFKFDNILKTMVKTDLSNGLVPMLLGEPGIGKSSWVESLAEDMNTKSFTLACNQLADKSDLTGARSMKVEKKVNGQNVQKYVQAFYPHVVIGKAIDYAESHPKETPILFLDELNRTTSDVTSEALSIPTLRSIGDQKLPDNLKVITAGNDKGNIVSLDTASVSRFVLYHVAPDLTTFIDINPSLNQDIKAVLLNNPSYIFTQPKLDKPDANDDSDDEDDDSSQMNQLDELLSIDNQLNQITTPRTITGLSKWLNSYSDQDLLSLAGTMMHDDNGTEVPLLLNAIQAHTGKTDFSDAVCSHITERLTVSGAGNSNTMSAPARLPEYDELLKAKTVTDQNKIISDLATTGKIEQVFVYALYDKRNNSQLIDGLVSVLPEQVSAKTNKTLFGLVMNGQLNTDNVRYLCSLDAPVAKTLSPLNSFI